MIQVEVKLGVRNMRIFVVREEFWSGGECFCCAKAAFYKEEDANKFISEQPKYIYHRIEEVELQ